MVTDIQKERLRSHLSGPRNPLRYAHTRSGMHTPTHSIVYETFLCICTYMYICTSRKVKGEISCILIQTLIGLFSYKALLYFNLTLQVLSHPNLTLSLQSPTSSGMTTPLSGAISPSKTPDVRCRRILSNLARYVCTNLCRYYVRTCLVAGE